MRIPNILLLSADQSETAQIAGILREYADLTPKNDPSQLVELLEHRDYDALLCGWSFQNGSWMDVLEEIRQTNPDLPVIVLSPTPDVREWAEVLKAGAFDLLVPPHDERSVRAALEHAAASRDGMEWRHAITA